MAAAINITIFLAFLFLSVWAVDSMSATYGIWRWNGTTWDTTGSPDFAWADTVLINYINNTYHEEHGNITYVNLNGTTVWNNGGYVETTPFDVSTWGIMYIVRAVQLFWNFMQISWGTGFWLQRVFGVWPTPGGPSIYIMPSEMAWIITIAIDVVQALAIYQILTGRSLKLTS